MLDYALIICTFHIGHSYILCPSVYYLAMIEKNVLEPKTRTQKGCVFRAEAILRIAVNEVKIYGQK